MIAIVMKENVEMIPVAGGITVGFAEVSILLTVPEHDIYDV